MQIIILKRFRCKKMVIKERFGDKVHIQTVDINIRR